MNIEELRELRHSEVHKSTYVGKRMSANEAALLDSIPALLDKVEQLEQSIHKMIEGYDGMLADATDEINRLRGYKVEVKGLE